MVVYSSFIPNSQGILHFFKTSVQRSRTTSFHAVKPRKPWPALSIPDIPTYFISLGCWFVGRITSFRCVRTLLDEERLGEEKADRDDSIGCV